MIPPLVLVPSYPPFLHYLQFCISQSHIIRGPAVSTSSASADSECLFTKNLFYLIFQLIILTYLYLLMLVNSTFSIKEGHLDRPSEQRGAEQSRGALMVKIMFCIHGVSEAPPPIFWCSWGICPILVRIGSEIDEGKKLPRHQPCRGRSWPKLFDLNIC